MSERGSMLPMIGALALAGIVVLVLALDVAMYAAVVREAAFAADAAAEAGAAHIDRAARYAGEVVVDPGEAVAVAANAGQAARPREGRQVDVIVGTDRVCVTVAQPFHGRLVSVAVTARASACAIPVEG